MRGSRLLLILALLFIGCFWWAGGDAVKEQAASKLGDAARQGVESSPGLENASRTIASFYDRAHRVFALEAAVERKIQSKNYVRLRRTSMFLQQAIIAAEDARFYSHMGFDAYAILRAGLVNLQYGRIAEGASTITQQLAKNLFLSQERSFGRKAEEFILALDLELRYPKEKILEMYLNTIYFGSGYYGIAEASMGYFAKMPDELTLAEAAMLAGLPNAPSLYSPYVDYRAAKERQSAVLDSMVKAGYISPETARETKEEELRFAG